MSLRETCCIDNTSQHLYPITLRICMRTNAITYHNYEPLKCTPLPLCPPRTRTSYSDLPHETKAFQPSSSSQH